MQEMETSGKIVNSQKKAPPQASSSKKRMCVRVCLSPWTAPLTSFSGTEPRPPGATCGTRPQNLSPLPLPHWCSTLWSWRSAAFRPCRRWRLQGRLSTARRLTSLISSLGICSSRHPKPKSIKRANKYNSRSNFLITHPREKSDFNVII
ncbi:uncharacterized protein [Oryctolagus cuniculus]